MICKTIARKGKAGLDWYDTVYTKDITSSDKKLFGNFLHRENMFFSKNKVIVALKNVQRWVWRGG